MASNVTKSSYGTGVYISISVYLAFLLGVAFFSWLRNRNHKNTIKGHYVASKSFGKIILSFTMFATMYSGYTVVGVPTDAFQNGWFALRWMGAILALVVTALLIHPIIRNLSTSREYLSPVDFIHDRYHSKFLQLLVAFCMIIPTWLYLTAQMSAMGTSVNGLTNGYIPTWAGSSILCIIILLYETLGGLRGVAWTDVLQGFLLILGFMCLSYILVVDFGSLPSRIPYLEKNRPTLLNTPSTKDKYDFFSFVFLWTSFPLYPHILQRVYAAKDTTTLRVTLTLMSFSSFITMIPGILLGIYGASLKSSFNPEEDGKLFFGEIMQDILSRNIFNAVIVTIVLTSSLAAIMSTADSALIGISNIVSVDLAKGLITPTWSENKLVLVGKVSSFISAGISLGISIAGISLAKLAVMQSSVLIQCLPGFLFGLYCPDMRSLSVSTGMIFGLTFTFFFFYTGQELYIAPGVWAFFLNCIVVIIMEFFIEKCMRDKFPLPEININLRQNLVSVDDFNRRIDNQSSVGNLDIRKTSTNHTWDRFGSVPLTYEVIQGYMDGIRQPISCWPLVLLSMLSLFLFVPFMWPSDVRSPLSNGIPLWAILSLSFLSLGSCSTAFLFAIWWKTSDKSDKTEMANISNEHGTDRAEEAQLMS